MPDITLIKTSSLGDVVHNLPVIADIRLHRPDARITWVVEEAYAPLVRLNPAVDGVIEVATRRWRQSLLEPAAWREMRALRAGLRAQRLGIVIDTQGLVRTALLARLLPGERHGYDRASMREPLGSPLYDFRHAVARTLHAIERNRILVGKALGYVPAGRADYGLRLDRPSKSAPPYAVLLHGSAQAAKEWPEDCWRAVGLRLAASGLEVVLPWGADRERVRSEALARDIPNARVPDRLPLDGMAALLADARLVVGLDTGLAHLAAALSVPLIAIFVASDPDLTGPRGAGPLRIAGKRDAPPDVASVTQAVNELLAG
jgi:heptosyltransferase I